MKQVARQRDSYSPKPARRMLELAADVYSLFLAQELSLSVMGNGNNTLLHLAARAGHADACSLLLQHGMAVDAANLPGCTPLHLAAGKGFAGVCQVLLQGGAAVDAPNSETERTPLHEAATCKGSGALETCQLLLQHGAAVDAPDCSQRTPLHLAAAKPKVDVCRLLLANGATVDGLECDQRTPLHYAAEFDQAANCELLIDHATLIDQDEWKTAADELEQTPLHLAAFRGASHACPVLLRRGAAVDHCDVDDRTALHIVAMDTGYGGDEERLDIIRQLLAYGASVDAVDCNSNTPLHLICGAQLWLCDNYELAPACDLLLKGGATVHAADYQGRTALQYAAEQGYTSTCKVLIDHGADPEACREEMRGCMRVVRSLVDEVRGLQKEVEGWQRIPHNLKEALVGAAPLLAAHAARRRA